jgi:heptosyltransferase-2
MGKNTAGEGLIKRAGQFAVYAIFRCVETVLRLLPLGAVARLGRVIGWIVYYFVPSYRGLAIDNLRIAFGATMDAKARKKLAHAHFARLGGNFLCGFKLPLMRQEDIVKRVTAEGIEHIRAAQTAGQTVVHPVCHLSCWELLTQVPSLFISIGQPASIYQPLGNPYLNKLVLDRRQKLGYTLFDRSEGFAGPLKLLRAGAQLGVLVDQHAGDKGVWCPFFGRLASTTPLAGLMAIRTKAAMLPMGVYDDGPGRWKLVCHPPVVSGEAKPTAEGLTVALNQVVEGMIRRSPADWFWVHNRWKTPKPDFLLSGYRRGIAVPAGMTAASLQPFELLVRSPNWLGDACMAFPAVRALKAGRPDLKLTVLGPEKLRELWTALPEVDRYIGKDGKEGLRSVSRKIKATGVPFDAAILLTNSTRSTLELWLAGIPRLAGYRGSLREKLLDQVAPDAKKGQPPEHHARKYLRLAEHCGADISSEALWTTGAPLRTNDGVIRIGICAGAEYGPAKRWPLERFAQVMQVVGGSMPVVEFVFLGAPGEAAMGVTLSQMVGAVRHQNLVGKTSLTELIACLQQCALLITNDTGTMHLAAAMGVPTVSIFGSTEPVLTSPLGTQHTIIRHHVPCSPCFKRECPFGHYDCMTGVSPQQVASAVLTKLQSVAG